jgi:hypothetical protein
MGSLSAYTPEDQQRTNPLLDHIDQSFTSMHPLAQQAVMNAIPRLSQPTPTANDVGAGRPKTADTPPPLASAPPTAPSGPAPLASAPPPAAQPSGPTPLATAPVSPLSSRLATAQEDQQRLAKGSGASQVKNPFLKTLATIGDVLGSGIAPRLGTFIPGTTAHHNLLVGENQRELTSLENQQTEEQKRATEAAQIPHIEAETALTEAQTKDIQDRLPKDPFALWLKQNPGKGITDYERDVAAGKTPTSQFELWLKQNPNGTVADFEKAQASGKPAGNAFELWQRENPNGTYKDFETQQQAITSKPLTKEHADALNASWSKIADKYHLPANQFHEGMTSAEASDLVKSFNDVVGKAQGGQNITIRQEAANTAATNTKDKETTAMYEKRRSEIERDLSPVNTQLDTIQEARHLIDGGAIGQALGVVKTLVGVAGGRGSGVRVTQPELNSIPSARSVGGDVEAFLNRTLTGKKLTDDQVKQVDTILGEIEHLAQSKQERANQTLTKMNAATSVKELKDIDDEYRNQGQQANGAVDPRVKAYADQYFGGDVTKAQAAIVEQRKGK